MSFHAIKETKTLFFVLKIKRMSKTDDSISSVSLVVFGRLSRRGGNEMLCLHRGHFS